MRFPIYIIEGHSYLYIGNILKDENKRTILERDVFTAADCKKAATTFRRFADTYSPVVIWVPELINHVRGLNEGKEDVARGWYQAMTGEHKTNELSHKYFMYFNSCNRRSHRTKSDDFPAERRKNEDHRGAYLVFSRILEITNY